MKNFVVVQHTYSEFLGLIESQLEKRDIGFSYFRPFVGQDLPGSPSQFDALFLLGGKVPATDTAALPWLESELALIGGFRRAGRPVVGIALGATLVVQQAGGSVLSQPQHQAYWTVAHCTEAGRGNALAEAVAGRPVLVLYNGDAQLPPGVEPLLVDDAGHWIAARMDHLTYALLFRPELKPGMLEDMVMEARRPTPPNIGELLAEARARWSDMQAVTDQVVVALVKELDLMVERHKMPVFHLQVSD